MAPTVLKTFLVGQASVALLSRMAILSSSRETWSLRVRVVILDVRCASEGRGRSSFRASAPAGGDIGAKPSSNRRPTKSAETPGAWEL